MFMIATFSEKVNHPMADQSMKKDGPRAVPFAAFSVYSVSPQAVTAWHLGWVWASSQKSLILSAPASS